MADLSHLVEKFFAAVQFSPGEVKELTIKSVEVEEIGEDKTPLPVVYFEEDPRGFVCKGTPYRTISEEAGTRDVDKWPGTVVNLSVSTFTKRGEDIAFVNLTV